MSHHHGPRRTRAEELSTADIEDSEPTMGLTTGDLSISPSPSVDPQQSLLPSAGSSRLVEEADSGQVSPTRGDTMEDFVIRGSKVVVLRQEYSEFITLKDNAEIVLAKAMEATERLNMVFNRVRASMSRMSLRMKELFSVPSNQTSGKTLQPSNNWAHDKAAAQAATQHIIAQTAMTDPAPRSGAEERARTTRSHVPGDRYSRAPLSRNIPEDIPHTAQGEQGEDSQPRRGHEAHTVYARDTPESRVRDMSRAQLARDVHVNSTESTRRRRDASPTNTQRELESVPTRDRPSLSAN
ncbi:hypothetical protein M422DRAFT_262530 [Sphaerobolus stellatus SS14]|uniref:Uncharacterized protein n=1 Tax=Sphaerobolus stellatus (strain SS14) TaxID=990650 RepID=A0A0C9UKI5_SPHS4|nr:hypothetical protein M422DRAFT_262530 [Sphaerobolus stellatus SS14]